MKRKMFYDAGPLLFAKTKYLRNHLTAAELKLWEYLRTSPMGLKFRRQHPIGIYIVDFYYHAAKLAIEADGRIHELVEVKQNDVTRQKLPEAGGPTVIRFSNNGLLTKTAYVITGSPCILQYHITPPFRGQGV